MSGSYQSASAGELRARSVDAAPLLSSDTHTHTTAAASDAPVHIDDVDPSAIAAHESNAPHRRHRSHSGTIIAQPQRTPKNACGCRFPLSVLALILFIVALVVAIIITVIVMGQQGDSGGGVIIPAVAERLFRHALNGTKIGMHLQRLTATAHVAGTEENYRTAVYVADHLRSCGFDDVRIESYDVLLCYPTQERSVDTYSTLTDPTPVASATLKEQNYTVDPSTSLPVTATFLAYSANGRVKAEVVYANYGRSDDFALLLQKGVNVSGKIALMRYGEIYRGNKVALAQQYGAVGALIYSDPADMGYSRGDVYPSGPWGPSTAAQRGSIWTGNGDPSTPGFPSRTYAHRLSQQQLYEKDDHYDALPSIPALPLSWFDAEPILSRLTGPLAPEQWQGSLPLPSGYRFGPGAVAVEMNVQLNYTLRTIHNVIARAKGQQEEDRIVLLGNHRDAWTFGAVDPNSGTATLLELSRSIGDLLKRGWRPRRSLWIASWDAEEYALIGSTEFAEGSESLLQQRLLAYLNVDIAVTSGGLLSLMGTPSLSNVTRAAAAAVDAPKSHLTPPQAQTMLDLWSLANNGSTTLDASAMGTGSDYGPFLQHIGAACVDMRVRGSNSSNDGYSGVYHTLYDDYRYMYLYADEGAKGFPWMKSLAAVWGTLALKLIDADVLPIAYTEYSVYMLQQLQKLQQLDTKAEWTSSFDSIFTSASKLVNTSFELDGLVVYINNNNLLRDPSGTSALQMRQLNDQLMLAERCLLAPLTTGIPGREWYRHVVWVNDLNDGYGSTAFAALSDAFQNGTRSDIAQALAMVNLVLDNMNECLTPPAWLKQLQP